MLLAKQILQLIFFNKEVFEIACGTGYWTQKIAAVAKSVLATDINETVIEVAKSKEFSKGNVVFDVADIFNMTNNAKYENLFGGFIWSHIKNEDLSNFVNTVNNLVTPGGTIIFIDNNYVAGNSLAITETDDLGNTYQTRTLENGTTHRVLKNFPSKKFIKQLLSGKVADINFISLQYYWILQYKCF